MITSDITKAIGVLKTIADRVNLLVDENEYQKLVFERCIGAISILNDELAASAKRDVED